MNKYLSLCALMMCLLPRVTNAQQLLPHNDSINLVRILNKEGEIKLNKSLIDQIDFGSLQQNPLTIGNKNLEIDATLPTLSSDTVQSLNHYLVLRPYRMSNVYAMCSASGGQKFVYDSDNPFIKYNSMSNTPSNWAKSPLDPGLRKSVVEIEATGLRYMIFADHLHGASGSAWVGTSGPSGIDLLAIFTKDFWDFKGKKNRARTKEVLKAYGDSITIEINHAVLANP